MDEQEFLEQEVLPYNPNAWMDTSKMKTGYEIPMTRFFYEYSMPENLDDVMTRIMKLEEKIDASVKHLFHKEG